MSRLFSKLGGLWSPDGYQSKTRSLTAKTVTLPKEKWFNKVYIPWLIPHHRSPHSNAVQTTKYTLLNFIPKNLWEQFRRFANIYFLVIALINFIPEIEAVGKEVAFLPLLFVLIVPAIKDAYEDYQRYKCDRQVNRRLTQVYDWKSNQYVKKQWSQVCVGDFIHLTCDEEIPADILLLFSSEPNNVCFIETANLDGETNLKQRQVTETLNECPTNRHIQMEKYDPGNFTGELFYEPPKPKIYEFSGYIQHPDGSVVGVSRDNLLLRGCILRNTRVIGGVVVYAGHETKSLLNNSGPRAKRSKLEKDINSDIIFQVGILFFICITGAVGSGWWSSMNAGMNAPFFPFTKEEINPALEGFIRFWSFLIVHQVIIPISLYVSMEIVKVAQVFFINSDLDMYYAPTDTPFTCRALNISENLGQIQHIFSDKTGTLTENHLLFRCCSIGGINYPHNLKSEFDNYNLGGSKLSLSKPVSADEGAGSFSSLHREEKVEVDESLVEAIAVTEQREAYYRDAFITMAICNTVLVSRNCRCKKTVSKTPNENGSPAMDILRKVINHENSFIPKLKFLEPLTSRDDLSEEECKCGSVVWDGGESCDEEMDREAILDVKYEAESPDDLALVKAARAYGYALVSRSPNHCTITTPTDGNLEFEVLDLLEFDSERRCMSIVTRKKGDAMFTVYTKGADIAIYSNLSREHTYKYPMAVSSPTSNRGSVFSNTTSPSCSPTHGIDRNPEICFVSSGHGYGELYSGDVTSESTNDSVSAWMQNSTRMHINMFAKIGLRTLCLAKRELTETEYQVWQRERQEAKQSIEDREELLSQSASNIEKRLILLGATGVEDRLQEGVPETVEGLREAGIKMWVLTGDKEETAVNIGYSSRLIEPHMDIIHLTAHTKEHCIAELERCLGDLLSLDKTGKDGNSVDSKESFIDSIPLLGTIYRQNYLGGEKSFRVHDKALLTNGETLRLLEDKNTQKKFLELAQRCRSVMCYRVAPIQKAMVVDIVKTQLHQMTLAIGDGANDVSMIQKADVGVGIIGREGKQAAMASDFAMARFKFLLKLLLVHGHWCYSRLARMMLYFFYKNLMYAMLMFWFQLFNGFSSSVPMSSINLLIFNIVYTSLPIMIVAVADQDVKASRLMEDKSLYKQGRKSEVYTKRKFFFAVVANGIYQSLVIFFVAYGVYVTTDVGRDEFGALIVVSAVLVATLHLAIDIYHWTFMHHISLWGSLLITFLFNYIYCSIPHLGVFADVYWVMEMASTRPFFWFTLLLTPVIALFPKAVAAVLKQEIFPTAVQKARAQEKQNKPRRQLQSVRT